CLTVVLRGNVDRVFALGAGENRALPGMTRDLADGHAFLAVRLGARLIVVDGQGESRGEQQQAAGEGGGAEHGSFSSSGRGRRAERPYRTGSQRNWRGAERKPRSPSV